MPIPVPASEVGFLAVFVLGVSLGLTACAVTCLPFIGTLVLGKAEGRQGGVRDTTLFLGGRLLAYAALGALAGALGVWFVRELAAGAGNLVIGLAGIFSAAWLLWPQERQRTCGIGRGKHSLPPLLLGIGLTLIPCAPLATLLAAAAAADSAARGLAFGLVFGFGTLLTPMLVLIPAAAAIGRQLRAGQRWLQRWLRWSAAVVLAALGGSRCDLFVANSAWSMIAIALLAVFWAYHRQQRRTGKALAVYHMTAESRRPGISAL